MDNNQDSSLFGKMASQDFDQAYKKGFMRAIMNKIAQKRTGLVSFDELRTKLDIQNQRDIGMQEIQIDKIIGSLSRYQDFDDSFLPRQTHTRSRWENIDRVYLKGEYLPPVEVYKIGEFYFVIDGNHRVSVARERGQKFIDAHVIELEIPFLLQGEFNWYEILLNQERADFYKKTGLKELRPDANVRLSLVGQYSKLLEHIEVHGYYTSEYLKRKISFPEAVCSWYDYIYTPMVEIIRKHNILRDFPKRTEADLYLWIIEHLAYLKNAYQRDISFEEAAVHFHKNSLRIQINTLFQKIQSGIKKLFK
jgi:uncharacterized ParB-like nuclease family protein